MREWKLEYESRPWTQNQLIRMNRYDRNTLTQEWRSAFCLLCQEQQIPRLMAIRVFAYPVLRDRRVQDIGACFPAVKAAIDGIVDAGVIPDDDPRFVTLLAMGAPMQQQPKDSLRLLLQEDALD